MRFARVRSASANSAPAVGPGQGDRAVPGYCLLDPFAERAEVGARRGQYADRVDLAGWPASRRASASVKKTARSSV